MGQALAMVGGLVNNIGSAIDYGAKEQADYQNIAEYKRSSAIEEANAVDALRQGEQDAGRARMKGSEMVARQRVAFANSGVDASVGTPAQVASSTSMWAELDAQTTRNNAMRKAFGYKETARKYTQAAESGRLQMDTDRVSFPLRLIGTTLASGSK